MKVNGSNRVHFGGRLSPAERAHRVLRLPTSTDDPVRIILAAQIQLRRWRFNDLAVAPAELQERVRTIIAARETLLELAFSLGSPHAGVHSIHGCEEDARPQTRGIDRGLGGLGSAAGQR